MTIGDILINISRALNFIIPFLLLLATAVFLWGILRYLTAQGDEQQLTEARTFIMYGIISLAVMISVWGLVALLRDFVFDATPLPNIPGADMVEER